MTENRKETTQDAIKQLAAYKAGQLADLRTEISREKAKAVALMTAVKAKRETLAAAEEETARREEEARLAEEAKRKAAEKTASEPVKEEVKEPVAEAKPVVTEPEPVKEEAAPAPEPAPEPAKEDKAAEVAPAVEEKPVEAPVEKKKKVAEATEKPAEPAEKPVVRRIISESNPSVQSEILPNGEIRRIYVPQETNKKVTTRVFAGGYNAGRGPRGQQSGQQQGQRPQQGGYGPRRDGLSASSLANAAQQAPVGKGGNQKGKGNQKSSSGGGQKFDDRGSMNKRALLKKGFIVDDRIPMDDEDAKVRVFKSKNKASSGGGTMVIDHAVITTDPVPIKVLSEKTGISVAEIIKNLFLLGIIKTINESIDFPTAELVIGEITKDHPVTLEFKPEITMEEALTAKLVIDDEDEDKLVPRPPVVTIMGHVDHGKTSLLDYIRKANVAGGEAGGITQHIGAYTISLKGSPITFLDTPGHEAFTSMRARGAQVTDIAVLVVAADDGIMPQTIEAINHARQANVPIIVAINKIDKTGEGVENLLENILIMAEMRELKANPDRPARGTIIEARLDKGIGKVATILVQTGTLRIGDNVVAGTSTGKIRAMIDDKGRKVKKAGPSIPVSVTGWDEVPEAGDIIDVVADEKFARELALERKLKQAAKGDDSGSVSLNDLFDKIKKGELKSVKLIIKADVQGSLEAVKQSLSKLGNEEVDIDIIHGAVGAIKESDVTLADTAKAIIIGFNVRPDANAKALAAQKKIDIRFYDIIYNAIEDIEKAVKGMLEPKFKEVVLGTAEVRELFRISGVGVIAGCHVTDGKIVRGAKARLLRNGAVEITSEIASLRHGKDDVKEMAKNFDCGIMLQNYQDIKVGDVIEAFEMEQINED